MKALSVAEAADVERLAFESGWSEGGLLRLAGKRLGWAVGRYFGKPGTAVGYLGKGHNAGDAVVALGVLRDEFGWEVAVRCAHPERDWAPLLREVWAEVGAIPVLDGVPDGAGCRLPLLLLDGLVGMGGRGGLRGPLGEMVGEMNELRSESGALVAAVDLPSGIDADTGLADGGHVVADVTFQIGNAKVGLLRHVAVDSVGSLAVVPLGPLAREGTGDFELIAPQAWGRRLAIRPYDTHKGQSGRVAVLAGSEEYPGAAVLCATGALRAGAGLVFLHVPEGAVSMVASRCPPEIIVRGVVDPGGFFADDADARVVGCGLGAWAREHAEELVAGIAACGCPTVVDADAVNVIAARGDLQALGSRHLLTPHPGEFRRLVPELCGLAREEAATKFVEQYDCHLLLKGARTLVAGREKALAVNSTGHPGMATGGQGDWLAGMIGALMAGGMGVYDSACMGAWLAGRCAEIGVFHHDHSAESLCPSDFAPWMGRAFHDWRTGSR